MPEVAAGRIDPRVLRQVCRGDAVELITRIVLLGEILTRDSRNPTAASRAGYKPCGRHPD